MNEQVLILLAVTFLAGLLLTGLVRYYALRNGILDIPNARSSHVLRTPRCGGLGMVVAFGFSILYLFSAGVVLLTQYTFLVALLFAGVALAVVGLIDDCRGGVSVRLRLLVHVAGSFLLVWACGQPATLDLGFGPLELGFWAYPLGTIGVVWILNLTNFMDGIDGLAGGQAVLACGLFAVFVVCATGSLPLALPPALLACAALGFLVWNFPPARIFMGDVGSGTLGLFFGGFAVWYAALLGPQWLYVWLLLLGVFVVDATYTLFRRVLRQQNIGQAHRSHAFQRASRQLGAHRPVVLAIYSIILFWLAPWAWAVAFYQVKGILALAVAYLPLLLLAKYFRAGEIDD